MHDHTLLFVEFRSPSVRPFCKTVEVRLQPPRVLHTLFFIITRILLPKAGSFESKSEICSQKINLT
ncbi:hypothetical protein BpHYR1_016148 [Brachionus plicatilis]|uniref:Uncharacterized protein n=1 Tax=Brachionus plicatilis TaxID=10195 RepID=A0A3M7RP79_BRAPC|nr:hypothetical protein BpHYR1_016148 [Brachionus plicatilis]